MSEEKTTETIQEETIAPQLEQHGKPNVRILYEKTEAIFVNQVIVNSGRDQVILDFSTGIISDHATGNHVLPIQQRLAMTPTNAASLVQTLSSVLRQISETNQAALQETESADSTSTTE